MRKEKLVSLQRYLIDLTNRLSSPVPYKHKDHPETYREFLNHEIAYVTRVIEAAKLEAGVK